MSPNEYCYFGIHENPLKLNNIKLGSNYSLTQNLLKIKKLYIFLKRHSNSSGKSHFELRCFNGIKIINGGRNDHIVFEV